MEMRRIVTGYDGAGRSVFVQDELVEAVGLAGMAEFIQVWAADEPSTYPNCGVEPETNQLFPPVGGYRFMITTIHPSFDPALLALATGTPADVVEAASVMEEEAPGFHRTDTTDFEIVLSGEMLLELDGGESRVVKAGEIVVQNGTRHKWSCAGDEPATFAAFMVGAHPR